MSEQFSPEVSDRICKHMNEDHANAVAIYAQTMVILRIPRQHKWFQLMLRV
jgi:putative heme iron utilization protein